MKKMKPTLSGISFNLALNYDKTLVDGHQFNATLVYQPEADITARTLEDQALLC
jgi:hypothetical protein